MRKWQKITIVATMIISLLFVGAICCKGIRDSLQSITYEEETEAETAVLIDMANREDNTVELVVEVEEEEVVPVFNETTVYTTGSVNLRQGPGTDTKIVKVLSVNTELTKIGEEGDWSKVKLNDEIYYISSKYISLEKTKLSNNTNKTTEPKTSFVAYITHYGPDCKGCSGVTAAGYDVRNTTYYDDPEYGTVRVVALDKTYPLYTIIRVNDYKNGPITAIVLDRGGAIKGNKLDLLVESEAVAYSLGIQTEAHVEILRWGK